MVFSSLQHHAAVARKIHLSHLFRIPEPALIATVLFYFLNVVSIYAWRLPFLPKSLILMEEKRRKKL